MPRRFVTEPEAQRIRVLARQGHSLKEIANLTNRPRSTVTKVLRRLEIEVLPPCFWSDKDLGELDRLYDDDFPQHAIGPLMDRSMHAVWGRLREWEKRPEYSARVIIYMRPSTFKAFNACARQFGMRPSELGRVLFRIIERRNEWEDLLRLDGAPDPVDAYVGPVTGAVVRL